jgi:hypothetical protein
MKTYGAVRYITPFLSLALSGDDQLHVPAPLTPLPQRVKAPNTNFTKVIYEVGKNEFMGEHNFLHPCQ